MPAGEEERRGLADQLEAVASRLHAELANPSTDIGHSLASAQGLRRVADRALQALVDAARARGDSWQRIGEALGTSRQAAFARFGAPLDPRTGEQMKRNSLPDADARALALLSDISAARWDQAVATFSPTVRQALGPTELADAWASVIGWAGALERIGEPAVLGMAEVTVVEVPLAHEAADLIGRVSYRADAQVAGLWFLPAQDALTGEGR